MQKSRLIFKLLIATFMNTYSMTFLPPRFVHTYVAPWFGFMARVCCEHVYANTQMHEKNNENVFICSYRKKVMRFTNNEFYNRNLTIKKFSI